MDGLHAEEQLRLRDVADYSLAVQSEKTLQRAQGILTRIYETAKKAATWVRTMTTKEWLLSLEAEGKANRRRLFGLVRERTGGSRI